MWLRQQWREGEGEINWDRQREQEDVSPALKVPRQCPLVLLVGAMHMIGISFYMTFEEHLSFLCAYSGQAIYIYTHTRIHIFNNFSDGECGYLLRRLWWGGAQCCMRSVPRAITEDRGESRKRSYLRY
jgi:hypothetical protein